MGTRGFVVNSESSILLWKRQLIWEICLCVWKYSWGHHLQMYIQEPLNYLQKSNEEEPWKWFQCTYSVHHSRVGCHCPSSGRWLSGGRSLHCSPVLENRAPQLLACIFKFLKCSLGDKNVLVLDLLDKYESQTSPDFPCSIYNSPIYSCWAVWTQRND